jgi:hypothetical protein
MSGRKIPAPIDVRKLDQRGWLIRLSPARLVRFAILPVLVLGAFIFMAEGSSPTATLFVPSRQPSVAHHTINTVFTFTRAAVSPKAMSESRAVSIARTCAEALPASRQVPANVTESVYYGNYTDGSFQSRPAWLVEYTGSGVNIGGGPEGRLGPSREQFDHAEAVAVDAFSGQLLDETTTEPSDLPTISVHAAAGVTKSTSQRASGILRTVSAAELSREGIVLHRANRSPGITRRNVLRVVRSLFSPSLVREAIPALVEHRNGRPIEWSFDWVLSLKPSLALRPLSRVPGHPRLNEPSNRKPFYLIFVNARTGKFEGESIAYYAGHFYEPPCSLGLVMSTHVDPFVSGRWETALTVPDPADRVREPVLYTGQKVRFVLTVRPHACFDRYSTVRLYFRRSYVGAKGVVQFRQWVGPQAWLHGQEIGSSAWRFVWQTRVGMRPRSHLLMINWNVTTASGTMTPDMIAHDRYSR